jgi:glyoxylase-like metal-dependent hydrolase (beta-lactamase superfamily II)
MSGMIEEIADSLYRLDIPLPDNPLRSINSYVIRSPGRNLVIDTGFDLPACLDAMCRGLARLGIVREETDFFITHTHADHAGLIARLITDTGNVYVNSVEMDFLKNLNVVEALRSFARMSGLTDDVVIPMMHMRTRYQYTFSPWIKQVVEVQDGDIIPAGHYRFHCVVTPGHTMGHTCLYDPEEKLLIAGDHILSDITPNITCWERHENRLKEYLSSLDRVFDMDVSRVLPGHRSVFSDLRGRIHAVKKHHERRVSAVMSILEQGPLSGVQVAARMPWNVPYKSWTSFPVVQQWFATGEAMAYLRYLEESGTVLATQSDGCLFFESVNS